MSLEKKLKEKRSSRDSSKILMQLNYEIKDSKEAVVLVKQYEGLQKAAELIGIIIVSGYIFNSYILPAISPFIQDYFTR